jgi:L-threonylcarbamoyladenylate synthase
VPPSDRPTRVLTIDPDHPDSRTIAIAAEVIRRGGLVAFPTETVYGLGANALDEESVRCIFIAKGRPAQNPLIVHSVGRPMILQVVQSWPAAAERLAERFWPGPLTLVVNKSNAVPTIVTGGGPTVGVRWPTHPVAEALIREAGVPLAAPSANRSAEVSPTRAEHVEKSLGGRIDLILDGGPTRNGIESTVLDLTTDPPVLLRPGPVSIADLERVIGPVSRRSDQTRPGPLPSPGLLPRHYAPRAPVELLSSREELFERTQEAIVGGERVGVMAFGEAEGLPGEPVAMPIDAREYAARLYAVLHELDARGFDRILIESPPDTDEWLAVRDRLSRAASPG